VVDEEILEKPRDADDAVRMLRLLSGRSHEVITGVCLLVQDHKENRDFTAIETTEVIFRKLTDEEIQGYVASGEPMDKAGAYAIQGFGARYIEEIKGDYFNVMGLPLRLLYELLTKPESLA